MLLAPFSPAELYAWRQRLEWTARRAAAELEVSQSQYRLLEQGYRYDRDAAVRPKRWLRGACERLEQLERERRLKEGEQHARALRHYATAPGPPGP